MSVVIRPARESELEQVARLLALVFELPGAARSERKDATYQEAYRRYREELVDVRGRQGHVELFVADEGGLIVGTGTLYPPGAGRRYASALNAKPWPNDWASLRLLAVHPAHREKGIGRMLLDARLRRARELGASFVALHTSEDFANARRWIQRTGWTRRPELDHAPAPGVIAEAYVLPLR
jgi:GNAT superfamily N-acetyltransferase